MGTPMAADQTPRTKAKKTVWLKACPRPGCGGDVGRFNDIPRDTFKCLMCSREVSPSVLRR